MERLRQISRLKVDQNQYEFKRYLLKTIDWSNRLIAVKGARGVGKTTMLLQYIRELQMDPVSVLYVSLDDIYFSANSLVDLADSFYKEGGKILFLDEVHKYPNWSREIKNVYDTFSELKIVFTSSSILEVNKGFADLSRRVVSYDLQGLSFREFLELTAVLRFDPVSLQEIMTRHAEIESEIVKQIRPLQHFKNYLEYGYYPYFKENLGSYNQKLTATINLTLESDLPSAVNIEYANIHKLKKLLYLVATSVPFKPNIQKLSQQILSTRTTVIQYLDHLGSARIIKMLNTDALGNGYLSKPDKIYLHDTNIMYALAPQMTNVGNLRETFFYNQLGVFHSLTLPEAGDFMVDKQFVFEVGGKNKTAGQISGIPNAYLAVDDIEYGIKNKIPLWLFGFLY